MAYLKFVYWEEEGAWLAYLRDYPDYWTQGETLDDLKEHLRALEQDLAGMPPSNRTSLRRPPHGPLEPE